MRRQTGDLDVEIASGSDFYDYLCWRVSAHSVLHEHTEGKAQKVAPQPPDIVVVYNYSLYVNEQLISDRHVVGGGGNSRREKPRTGMKRTDPGVAITVL